MHSRTGSAATEQFLPVTLALGLGTFLVLFDVTSVVVATPAIVRDLGFAIAGAVWVVDAYSLAFAVTLLASGALADRFGRRRAMLSGNAVFLIASVACGLATTGPMLLASRTLQGVGAAFMVTGAISLVAGAFPHQGQRTRAFGVIGVISGVAMAMGPSFGGVLASWVGWRWIFFANIPFCLALALGVPRLVAETSDPHGRPLDPVGFVLLTVSLGLVIDSLLRRDGSIEVRAACIVGGGVAALLFVLRQLSSSCPVLDPRIFATSAMAGVGALLLAIQFSYWAVLVYLPLFLNVRLMVSIEVAGMALLAATLPMLIVPMIGGRLVGPLGWRRFFVVAFATIAAGDALLAFAAVASNSATCFAASIAGMLAIGVGAALANPQMSSIALALAPPAQAGMASAVTLIVRQAGFAISVAALGSLVGDFDKGFAPPFALAVFAALVAIVTALVLLPASSQSAGPS
jgi:MFS family permease